MYLELLRKQLAALLERHDAILADLDAGFRAAKA